MRNWYEWVFAASLALPGFAMAVDQATGTQAFATVQKVLQHPRCQNCHIPGDAPLQFDEGRTHAMSVQRGRTRRCRAALRGVPWHEESADELRRARPAGRAELASAAA